MTHISYGVCGTGYFGAQLARAIEGIPGASVSAVYDPANATAVARDLGCEAADSLHALCASPKVDALIVASPNWAHREPALLAAANGKHVFCEKPIALSYRECDEMVQSARRHGVILMAGHVMNFMDGIRHVRGLIADGVIGDLLFCRAVRNGWRDEAPQATWKASDALSGGHLYHHIHELDMVQSLMGSAKTVTMVGGPVASARPPDSAANVNLLISLEFGNQRLAALEYGSAFRWPEHYVLIEGSVGAALVDLQHATVVLKTRDRDEHFLLHRSREENEDRVASYRARPADAAVMHGGPDHVPPLWLRGVVETELTYFHGLACGDSPTPDLAPLTDGSAAAASIATADALSRSLQESRKVSVAEITG